MNESEDTNSNKSILKTLNLYNITILTLWKSLSKQMKNVNNINETQIVHNKKNLINKQGIDEILKEYIMLAITLDKNKINTLEPDVIDIIKKKKPNIAKQLIKYIDNNKEIIKNIKNNINPYINNLNEYINKNKLDSSKGLLEVDAEIISNFIDNLKTILKNTKSDINTNEKQLKLIKLKITKNNEKILILEEEQSNVTEEIKDLNNNIKYLKATFTNITKQKDNETVLNELRTERAEKENKLDSLKKELKSINNKIEKLKNESDINKKIQDNINNKLDYLSKSKKISIETILIHINEIKLKLNSELNSEINNELTNLISQIKLKISDYNTREAEENEAEENEAEENEAEENEAEENEAKENEAEENINQEYIGDISINEIEKIINKYIKNQNDGSLKNKSVDNNIILNELLEKYNEFNSNINLLDDLLDVNKLIDIIYINGNISFDIEHYNKYVDIYNNEIHYRNENKNMEIFILDDINSYINKHIKIDINSFKNQLKNDNQKLKKFINEQTNMESDLKNLYDNTQNILNKIRQIFFTVINIECDHIIKKYKNIVENLQTYKNLQFSVDYNIKLINNFYNKIHYYLDNNNENNRLNVILFKIILIQLKYLQDNMYNYISEDDSHLLYNIDFTESESTKNNLISKFKDKYNLLGAEYIKYCYKLQQQFILLVNKSNPIEFYELILDIPKNTNSIIGNMRAKAEKKTLENKLTEIINDLINQFNKYVNDILSKSKYKEAQVNNITPNLIKSDLIVDNLKYINENIDLSDNNNIINEFFHNLKKIDLNTNEISNSLKNLLIKLNPNNTIIYDTNFIINAEIKNKIKEFKKIYNECTIIEVKYYITNINNSNNIKSIKTILYFLKKTNIKLKLEDIKERSFFINLDHSMLYNLKQSVSIKTVEDISKSQNKIDNNYKQLQKIVNNSNKLSKIKNNIFEHQLTILYALYNKNEEYIILLDNIKKYIESYNTFNKIIRDYNIPPEYFYDIKKYEYINKLYNKHVKFLNIAPPDYILILEKDKSIENFNKLNDEINKISDQMNNEKKIQYEKKTLVDNIYHIIKPLHKNVTYSDTLLQTYIDKTLSIIDSVKDVKTDDKTKIKKLLKELKKSLNSDRVSDKLKTDLIEVHKSLSGKESTFETEDKTEDKIVDTIEDNESYTIKYLNTDIKSILGDETLYNETDDKKKKNKRTLINIRDRINNVNSRIDKMKDNNTITANVGKDIQDALNNLSINLDSNSYKDSQMVVDDVLKLLDDSQKSWTTRTLEWMRINTKDNKASNNNEASTGTTVTTSQTAGSKCSNSKDSDAWDKHYAKIEKNLAACANNAVFSWSFDDSVSNCMREKINVSDDCSSCFGKLAGCTKTHCASKCAFGNTPGCAKCVKENKCETNFTSCSGKMMLSEIKGGYIGGSTYNSEYKTEYYQYKDKVTLQPAYSDENLINNIIAYNINALKYKSIYSQEVKTENTYSDTILKLNSKITSIIEVNKNFKLPTDDIKQFHKDLEKTTSEIINFSTNDSTVIHINFTNTIKELNQLYDSNKNKLSRDHIKIIFYIIGLIIHIHLLSIIKIMNQIYNNENDNIDKQFTENIINFYIRKNLKYNDYDIDDYKEHFKTPSILENESLKYDILDRLIYKTIKNKNSTEDLQYLLNEVFYTDNKNYLPSTEYISEIFKSYYKNKDNIDLKKDIKGIYNILKNKYFTTLQNNYTQIKDTLSSDTNSMIKYFTFEYKPINSVDNKNYFNDKNKLLEFKNRLYYFASIKDNQYINYINDNNYKVLKTLKYNYNLEITNLYDNLFINSDNKLAISINNNESTYYQNLSSVEQKEFLTMMDEKTKIEIKLLNYFKETPSEENTKISQMKNHIYKESFINNTNLKDNKPIELLDKLINMLNKFITKGDFTGADIDTVGAQRTGADIDTVGAQGTGTAIKKSDLHETVKIASINAVKKLVDEKHIKKTEASQLIDILEDTTQADLIEFQNEPEFIKSLKPEYTPDQINSLKEFDENTSYTKLWGITDRLRTCALSTGIDRLAQNCNESAYYAVMFTLFLILNVIKLKGTAVFTATAVFSKVLKEIYNYIINNEKEENKNSMMVYSGGDLKSLPELNKANLLMLYTIYKNQLENLKKNLENKTPINKNIDTIKYLFQKNAFKEGFLESVQNSVQNLSLGASVKYIEDNIEDIATYINKNLENNVYNNIVNYEAYLLYKYVVEEDNSFSNYSFNNISEFINEMKDYNNNTEEFNNKFNNEFLNKLRPLIHQEIELLDKNEKYRKKKELTNSFEHLDDIFEEYYKYIKYNTKIGYDNEIHTYYDKLVNNIKNTIKNPESKNIKNRIFNIDSLLEKYKNININLIEYIYNLKDNDNEKTPEDKNYNDNEKNKMEAKPEEIRKSYNEYSKLLNDDSIIPNNKKNIILENFYNNVYSNLDKNFIDLKKFNMKLNNILLEFNYIDNEILLNLSLDDKYIIFDKLNKLEKEQENKNNKTDTIIEKILPVKDILSKQKGGNINKELIKLKKLYKNLRNNSI